MLAFDHPRWVLTSRPRRKDWEEKNVPNPYELESLEILLTIYSHIMSFKFKYLFIEVNYEKILFATIHF